MLTPKTGITASGSAIYQMEAPSAESNLPIMSAENPKTKRPTKVEFDPMKDAVSASPGNMNSTINTNVSDGDNTSIYTMSENEPPSHSDFSVMEQPTIHEQYQPAPNYSEQLNGDWSTPSEPRTVQRADKGKAFNPWPIDYWLPIVALVAAAFFIYAIVKGRK